jgi:hypothetical protein
MALALAALVKAAAPRQAALCAIAAAAGGSAPARWQSGAAGRGAPPASSADAGFQLDDLLTDSDKEAPASAAARASSGGARRPAGGVGAAASARPAAAAAAPRAPAAAAAGSAQPPPLPGDDLALEVDPAMRAAREEARAAIAARKRAADAAAAAAARDVMPAIVDSDGAALPLASDDEGALPDVPADAISPEDARRAVKQLAYHARHMRASLEEPADLETYSAALEAEFGSELEMADPLSGASRPDDYAPGADPLLDAPGGLPFAVSAVGFRTHMTWNSPPGSRKIDR